MVMTPPYFKLSGKIEEEVKFIDLLRIIFGNNSFVTDLWKSGATDIWLGHVGLLNWSRRPMDGHLVRQSTFGHLHFPLPQPVGAAAELELVGD